MKCPKNKKLKDGKCVLRKFKNGIAKTSSIARLFIIGMLIVLSFLFALNLGNLDVLYALGFNFVILGISYLAYRAPELQDDLIGIDPDSFKGLRMVGWGLLFTIVFYLATLLIPGLSIGFPQLPGDISGSLKWFLINIVSPITETFFFLGVVLAFFRNLKDDSRWGPIIFSSFVFAFFHLGAYIVGFYQYPDFTTALGSFFSNLSAFLVAFLFNLVAGWWITRPGVQNLIFGFVFHFGLNFIAFTFSVVTFF